LNKKIVDTTLVAVITNENSNRRDRGGLSQFWFSDSYLKKKHVKFRYSNVSKSF